MKILRTAVASLMLATNLSAQTQELGTFRSTEKIIITNTARHHTAHLTVRTREFRASRYRMTTAASRTPRRGAGGQSPAEPHVTSIDGRVPLGTAGATPSVEIESVVVTFDGARIVVPRALYADCYNPRFDKDRFATKLSADGKSLLVFMAGGAKESTYQVVWIIRKDGRHSRFVDDCPDCEYQGILTFMRKD